MSTLVIQIPHRQRLRSGSGSGAAPEPSDLATEYTYVISPDGLALESQGRCAAALRVSRGEYPLPSTDQKGAPALPGRG